jgi:hypothetical protein
MKTELREAWEDSMLSGLFPQGTDALNDHGYYCCLGVLCETAIELGMPVERYEHEGDCEGFCSYGVKGENRDMSMLTDGLLELFDMSKDDANRLAKANDGGTKFKEIVNMVLDENTVSV